MNKTLADEAVPRRRKKPSDNEACGMNEPVTESTSCASTDVSATHGETPSVRTRHACAEWELYLSFGL